MNITNCFGFECEKALPTTVEDQFNQSEVSYELNGEQRSLTVIYVRYFDEYVSENGIYKKEESDVPFYNIVALLILMKNEGEIEAKRIYYNETDHFLDAFENEHIEEALSIYRSIKKSA